MSTMAEDKLGRTFKGRKNYNGTHTEHNSGGKLDSMPDWFFVLRLLTDCQTNCTWSHRIFPTKYRWQHLDLPALSQMSSNKTLITVLSTVTFSVAFENKTLEWQQYRPIPWSNVMNTWDRLGIWADPSIESEIWEGFTYRRCWKSAVQIEVSICIYTQKDLGDVYCWSEAPGRVGESHFLCIPWWGVASDW